MLPLITCQARKVRVVVFWLFVGQQLAHVTLVQTTLLTSRQMGWGGVNCCASNSPKSPTKAQVLSPVTCRTMKFVVVTIKFLV